MRSKIAVFSLIIASVFTLSHQSVTANGSPATPVPNGVVATEDAYVEHGDNANRPSDFDQLIVKMGTANGNTSRATYVKFEYDPSYDWTAAALELVVSGNSAGAGDTAYGTTFKSFNVNVYGATEASWRESTLTYNFATASSENWKLNNSVIPWKLDSGTYLGSLAVPADPTTVGTTFSVSNTTLRDFLNADADGKVTIVLVRTDPSASSNLSFASTEYASTLNNSNYAGPKLVVPGANFRYAVSYDINSATATGSVPAQGEYVAGGAPYTIAAPSSIVPEAGKVFVGWNTKIDGKGIQYPVGSSYSSYSSVTLYAQYTSNPVVTMFSNDDSNQIVYQEFQLGQPDALRANSFTREGYTFTGWNTARDGRGTSYADEVDVITSTSFDLFAQWSADNGNSNPDNNPTPGEPSTGSATPSPITTKDEVQKDLPTVTQMSSTVRVIASGDKTKTLQSKTPETCLAIEGRVIMIKEGKCTVQIRSTKSRSASSPQPRLLATLNTLISSSGTQAGLKITKRSLIRFAKYSSTPIGIPSSLTRQARKAQGVIVIGHTALFSGNSRANQKLSDARANYVRTHFINQKVRPAVILFDGVAAQQPIRKTLTEKDQRINRRVEVYLLS